MDYQVDPFSLILSPKIACGKEIKHFTGLESKKGHIFGSPNETFVKKDPFLKKMHFSLLDDHGDSLSFFWARNFACGEENMSPPRRNSNGDTFFKSEIHIFDEIDPQKAPPPFKKSHFDFLD